MSIVAFDTYFLMVSTLVSSPVGGYHGKRDITHILHKFFFVTVLKNDDNNSSDRPNLMVVLIFLDKGFANLLFCPIFFMAPLAMYFPGNTTQIVF